MTVTRQSLRFKCSVKDCPWRDDKEIHCPWCLGIPGVEHWADKPTHQHWPKKGMGGKNPKSKIVAILCVTCHDRIDNGDWGNAVVTTFEDGQRIEVYRAWDLHNETLIERIISVGLLSDGAEGAGLPVPRKQSGKNTSSAPSLSKEESDGLDAHGSSPSGDTPGGEVGEPTETGPPDKSAPVVGDDAVNDSQHRSVSHSHVLTHEQRVAKAQEIKDMEWNRQWIAGDTGNAWIAELGEEAEQYLSDFGYVHESLANILYVCEAIPKNMRRSGLRFSHHVVMLGLNREDMEMWLDKCEEEQWSVAEFRRQVKGTKPKVKRWSRPELQERWDGFWAVREQENPGWDFGSLVKVAFAEFLDWLSAEEQG